MTKGEIVEACVYYWVNSKVLANNRDSWYHSEGGDLLVQGYS
jgi:hypothetical protein